MVSIATKWRRERLLYHRLALIIGLAALLSFATFSMELSFGYDSFLVDTEEAVVGSAAFSPDIVPPRQPQVIKTTANDLLKNHTLVIILGDLRCGDPAWESLYNHVLDFNNADLALFTQPPPQQAYANATMFERAMHVEMVPSYTDWSEALDLVDGVEWRARVGKHYNPTTHPSLLGGAAGYLASGAIVNMYKWFAAQRIIDRNWLSQYDRFVVTRTDQYYDYPLDLSKLDPQYLWIPEGEDYGGITDRFFIASSALAIKALDTISPFLKSPASFQYQFKSKFTIYGPFPLNCEKYLWYVWKYVGLGPKIRRFHRGFFTCMAPIDNSRWGVLGALVDEGVHLKYPLEYRATKNLRWKHQIWFSKFKEALMY